MKTTAHALEEGREPHKRWGIVETKDLVLTGGLEYGRAEAQSDDDLGEVEKGLDRRLAIDQIAEKD